MEASCKTCKVFYDNDDGCHKRVKTVEKPSVKEDGFTEVDRKKGKGKQHVRQVDGVRLQNQRFNTIIGLFINQIMLIDVPTKMMIQILVRHLLPLVLLILVLKRN